MRAEVEEQIAAAMQRGREEAKGQGMALPCDGLYSGAPQAEWERDALFGRSWLPVARESQLEVCGSFQTIEVAGTPLVVVRGGDGKLRVLHNICRHRGAQIVRTDEGQLKHLRCAYHGLQYGLDGRPEVCPEPESFRPEMHSACLPSATVASYGGWVWATLEESPCSLEDYLGPQLLDELDNWPLAECVAVDGRHIDAEFDWKIGVEAFLEPFHVPAIHSRTAYPLVDYRGMAVRALGEHSRMALPFRVPDVYGPQGFFGEAAHRAGVPMFAGLNKVQKQAHLVYLIFPCTILMLMPNHFLALSFLPRGVGRCQLRYLLLAHTPGSPAAAAWLDSLKLGYNKLLEEDLVNLPWIQSGVTSGSLKSMELSGYERRIGLFRSALEARCT